jgi:hypothetical protein
MRYLIIILASLMLVGCSTPRALTSISSVLPFGSSVEAVCKINDSKYIELRDHFGGGKVVKTCSDNSFVEYFPEFKTQIIIGQGGSHYFVFENVNQKMSCNSLYCSYGDGKLKFITVNEEEAKRMANPKLMAEYEKELEEAKKKYLEEQREQVKKDEQERKRLKEKEEYERKVKLEYLDKTYGKKCLAKKNNIADYNSCLFEQERTVLAQKQEQERIANKAKLEEQNKLANMPPSERYAYTCEKTYGFRKGTDNFKECVFKIMTTEYEMQNQLNQRRIAELERKVASNQANTTYQNEMLEIERMKAKAMQDQVNFAKNKDITDTLLGISNNLLNPPRKAAPNAPQMFNCQTRKFGGFDQIQCF